MNAAPAPLLCALLAAGQSVRFGGAKLDAKLGGQLLGSYAATTMITAQLGHCVAIVSAATPALTQWLAERNMTTLVNTDPGHGLGSSLALAIAAAEASEAAALLIMLGDMPFVSVDHLHRLRAAFVHCSVSSEASGVRMPPAILPRSVWPSLMAVPGDRGARALLADSVAVTGDSNALFDVDTPADLARAEGMIGNR